MNEKHIGGETRHHQDGQNRKQSSREDQLEDHLTCRRS